MKVLKKHLHTPSLLSPFFLFSVILTFIIAMPLVCAAVTSGRDVTLQWDPSIDAPNLQSYRIYYYTTQGVVGSLDTADYATAYTLLGGSQIPINPLSDPKTITIDKSHTQITIHSLNAEKNYYFTATSIDQQGLESVFTPEVCAPAASQEGLDYTVTSVPEGRQVVVDGNTYTTPKVFNWLPGTVHTIGVMSPQAGAAETRYMFQGWSDQGTQSHTVTAPETTSTFTVTFGTQYALTKLSATGLVNPAGTGVLTFDPSPVALEGGRHWYALNQMVTVTATPANAVYAFVNWAGGPITPAGGAAPAGGGSGTLVMDGPKSLTANFGKLMDYKVTSVPEGRQVVVDGSTYTTPKVFNWLSGSEHTVGVTSPQAGVEGTRYVFQGWSDQGARIHTVTAPQTATTYTVTFGTMQRALPSEVNRILLLLLLEEN